MREERESWSQFVERQILEAIERGDFDNLPGAGKPLDLTENPFVPDELRLAFRLLKQAGFAPEWIELDKEIRADVARCDGYLHRHKEWLAAMVAQLPRASDSGLAAGRAPDLPRRRAREVAALDAAHRRFLADHRARLADLNRKIERFNWLVPAARLRRQPVRLDPEWDDLPERLLRRRAVALD